MSTPFSACVQTVFRLNDAVRELARLAEPLQLPPLAGREWYEQLLRKLLPQLAEQPFLVAAVVGGTNIGKSVVFNHIAGCRASATSPLASKTQHPVCLVPVGFADHHKLANIFQGFKLLEWEDANAAIESHDEHHLYWRVSAEVPQNLLVLDTPDIDGDAVVNWLRADRIRACADVLVAVLTQQKYNDAAVKQFFRKAAAEDKAVLVVFNLCQLPDDEAYWPLWLETFSKETGVKPDHVYVAPIDRRAAESNSLMFYPRAWPVPVTGTAAGDGFDPNMPRLLGADLAELHFSEIKLRTLRGSLMQLIAERDGVPAYLAEIQASSSAFQAAADLLSAQKLAQVDNWPTPPNSLLIGQVRQWWRSHREGWTRTIHDTYGKLGEGLSFPFRWVHRRVTGEPPDLLEVYRKQEWDVILQTVNQLFEELSRLSHLGNEQLRPRLESVLAGSSRSALIEDLRLEHAKVDLEAEFNEIVAVQMQAFAAENPGAFSMLRRLDSVAAAARPLTSVVLFFAAAGPVGHAVLPMVTDAAAQSLVHVVGDVAGGAGAVVVGEAAMSQTAGRLRQLEAHFRRLNSACASRRVEWLVEFLRTRVLGQLQSELQNAIGVPQTTAFRTAIECVKELQAQLGSQPAQPT